MSNPFATYKRLATRGEIAQQITLETIEEHQAARKGREEESWNAEDTARMERLATLMIGPHAAVVIPHVLRAYPQMAQLIDRKVGRVVSRFDGDPKIVSAEIQGIDGTAYTYFRESVDGELALQIGDTVSFRASDDGVAQLIQMVEAAAQPVGQA